MRNMIDSAERPPAGPSSAQPFGPPLVVGGYLDGGDVFRVWTSADWLFAASIAKWLVPIGVASSNMDGATRAQEMSASAHQVGVPLGVGIVLDVEQYMAAELAKSGAVAHWAETTHNLGRLPIVYASESTVAELGGEQAPWYWWPAAWTGHEPAQADYPWAAAVQYSSPTVDPALAVDLSVVFNDSLALWEVPSVQPEPQPQPEPEKNLNAPVVAIVDTKTGGGYWLVAADGGVFAFGDAIAFNPDPIPSEKLVRPIVSAASTPSGRGLILAGADGGVFTLGDAAYKGSIPGDGIGPAPE